jgi:putative membrane protein
MPGAATGATTPGTAAEGGGRLTPGANSFTEGQARDRISDAGFSDVQGLRLDEQGIWRGRAIRNGRQTGVALDYQGNVAATQ